MTNKMNNYNQLFADLQDSCNKENCCNAFSNITLEELKELNHLLDRLIIFCENIDFEEELAGHECSEEVFELYKLADELFTRDLNK